MGRTRRCWTMSPGALTRMTEDLQERRGSGYAPWPPDMIAPGKTCTVYGYPHTNNPDEARIEYIILDGKRIELR